MATLLVKRLTETATLPSRASAGAAGYDLCADEEAVVASKTRKVISTGISLEIGNNLYGRIAPRSGLAIKNGICIMAGVVDSDYRGEVKVVIINHGSESMTVKKGDRIAQIIFEMHATPVVEEVKEHRTSTARDSLGFGSTGVTSLQSNALH